MNDLLAEYLRLILGEQYVRPFISLAAAFPVLLFCTLLFAHSINRRKLFILRFLAGLLIIFGCYAGATVMRTEYPILATRIITNYFSYFVTLPLLFLCYRDTPANILLSWCAGFSAQEIASRAFSLMLVLVGVDIRESMSFFGEFSALRDYTIFYLVHFLIVLLLYRIFRQNKYMDEDRSGVRTITALSVFAALWLTVSNSVAREFQLESDTLYQVLQISSAIFAVFVLLLRTGIFSQSQYRHEIALMEQILHEERKQYQSVKENIDIINMKCHDLKHQLSNFSGKLTDQEIQSLQEAIKIYDSNIKTGSEVLDVLLYEKQLVCQKDGITLTCMADGKALSFMRTSHVYSIFNNALGNALEAVRNIPDPDMRIVDISVARSAGTVEIVITNYFQGERSIQAGLPVATTKEDKNRHGFGTMSMKYVAEQYGGTLQTSIEGPIFILKICIPIPESAAK